MPEDKPTESKPKSKQREFVKYQDLSKEDLVRMLMRINKRLSRISRELREVTDILYYGYTQGVQSEGQGRRNSGNYRKDYNRQYGRYGNRKYKRRSENEDEDDVNYE
jgi:hypothetical protein